ncbi:tryptophan synthase, alpha chain [Halobacillus karajensis]|uniref:Tryptophan synthase alpha chain n=1 Tax=Halobacillus karajensis TaxID=195088 RepID=A0A024P5R7_9BACI|nr:tryptophan synthase subunit alpha [Halobacillus karajensis]CDQ20413.1 Tryptophan synthase alpha chain [Halobacillus karajensis]CDQ24118.1 Tryptophan synthase alpha chain [Halobacillus karajensis]CDQ27596.1 Tryptophan synthase alpha chain [Halobacillus karajensis]SEH92041.1 tryptophan synthase, alpha chain [Halobacillus karajensis]
MLTKTSFQGKLTKTDNLFIPFIVAGDPSSEFTIQFALRLQEEGADVLELGVPYSDPLADGPTIQRAAQRALRAGMSLRKAIELVPELRRKGLTIPVVIFTYYNPVIQIGHEEFFQLLEENSVEGLLIPDLPFEESGEIRQQAEQKNIEFISLIAPNSDQRIKQIAEHAKGFLYCVSSLGVTGERKDMAPEALSFIKKVKQYSQVPVAVGFGISSNEHVKLVRSHADGVIIGSKIIRLVEAEIENIANGKADEALDHFTIGVRELVK